MLRPLLAVLGALELLFPERIVQVSTRLAYESPDEFEVRPWVLTAVRLEGIVFLFVGLRGLFERGDAGDRISVRVEER